MKKIISILLCTAMVFSLTAILSHAENTLPEPPAQAIKTNEKTNYEKIASNKECILYADMTTGYFALQNISTGYIWYSVPKDSVLDEITKGADKWNMRSQITVNYIYDEDVVSAAGTSSANSYQSCIENGSVKVKKIKNGIRAEYVFGDIKSTVPVEYSLRENGFTAKIDIENIKEAKGCYITDINLLPAFGAANKEQSGELLIPDGSGALIEFNNGKDTPVYEAKIYGNDLIEMPERDSSVTETIHLPVFATMTGNNALMGIVTTGDGSSSIRALSGNDDRFYNAVSTVVNLRSLEKLMMFKTSAHREIGKLTSLSDSVKSYEVRYNLLSGEKSDYVGVAEKYREYLVKEKGLKKQKEEPKLSLDIYGAIDVKAAFLGFEYSKLSAITTFAQAEKIVNKLSKNTDVPLAIRYLGWSNYGILNKKLPAKADALSKLGGNKGFKSLEDKIKSGGGTLYADVDFMRFRAGSNKKAVKNAFNKTVEHTERLRSVYATKLDIDSIKLLSPQYLKQTSDKYLKSLKSKKITAVSLSTLGNMIYSNSSQKTGFHRFDFVKVAENILSSYKKSGIKLSVEGGNAYTLPYVNRVYNAPVFCSGYDIFDKEIPFYQTVLHGYVALTNAPAAQSADRQLNILKAVQGGSELLYGGMYKASSAVTDTRYDYLFSTEYSLWADDAAANANRIYKLLDCVKNSVITEHTEIAENVILTVYDNGTKVIVNYGKTEVDIMGIKVNAMDYGFIKGGN